jgi:hypothetical protein
MGLCGSKDGGGSLEKPGQGILTVYGDLFSSETRTLMLMIHMGGVNHNFHPVDQFKGEHK